MTLQRFHLGDTSWEAESDPATPVYLAGPPMYLICSVGGGIHPYGDEHLVGKMGGAWAHPVRVLHGWSGAVEENGTTVSLDLAARCDLYGSHLIRHHQASDLIVEWCEFVADELPALTAQITLRNGSSRPWSGNLLIHAELDLRGCWFGGWGSDEPAIHTSGALLTASGTAGHFAGRAAAFLADPLTTWQVAEQRASAHIPVRLGAGEERRFVLALAVAHAGGAEAAIELARRVRERAPQLLEAKIARYTALLAEMVIETPDPSINAAWQLARLNMHLLTAAYPELPPYFLAGLPEYPQLFGCDNEYTVPGATAAGFGALMRSTLRTLAAYGERACGRIPHEITTNGRIFNPGNTQETPQFAAACWDYLRWSGDLEFLAEVYPLCVEGLEHFRSTIEGHGYPHGDGVVERPGMGTYKLDSVGYLYQALVALREMALALGREDDAPRFAEYAAGIRDRFEREWWIEREGLYADSLHLDRRPQLDGHWTVVLPVQLGLASRQRAEQIMSRIEAEWVNEWGLVHTRGAEPYVWTLPTGLLALAAFAHSRPELALKLIRNIAVTAWHGPLGMLKELIPQGICFIQLWSSGLLIEALTEGLLGLRPLAHLHRLEVRPHLPPDWSEVWLRGLKVGQHTLDLRITQSSLEISHREGNAPLTVVYGERQVEVGVGDEVAVS
jgi:glycogen debranching enzyme